VAAGRPVTAALASAARPRADAPARAPQRRPATRPAAPPIRVDGVLRRCACGGSCPRCRAGAAHPRLAINTPGDAFERQADAAADAVMSSSPAPSASASPSRVLRRCACGGSCPSCKKEKEEELQREDAGAGSAPGFAPPVVHQVLASPGRPLDAAARGRMEAGFGADFSAVRVHDDPRAAESAHAVDAHAYTVGSDIVFASGRYAPGTAAGDRLLAHELAHTLQQGGTPGVLRRDAAPASSSPPTPPARPTELTIDVLAANAPESDRFLAEEAAQTLGTDITVSSLADLVDQLHHRTQGGPCVRLLRIFHHGNPEIQRVGERGGFTFNLLLDERNQPALNRLRGAFCCGARMHWLGCSTAGVLAPGGTRTRRERDKPGERFSEQRDWYQSLDDAAAHGADRWRATLGSTNVQAWSNATCTTIRAANDFVHHEGSRNWVLYGGSFQDFPPDPDARCACDAATGRRPAGDRAPTPDETVRLLSEPCSDARGERLRAAIGIAQTLAHGAVIGLEAWHASWGHPLSGRAHDATAMGLRRGFNIEPDKSLWLQMGMMTAAELAAREARDQAVVATILANFREIEAGALALAGMPLCSDNPAGGTACVGCLSAQYPRCHHRPSGNVVGFVQSLGSVTGGIFLCPSFFEAADDGERAETLLHEIAHQARFRASDLHAGTSYYGCPVAPVTGHVGLFDPGGLARIAAAYECFIREQRRYNGHSPLADEQAAPASRIGADDMNAWALGVIFEEPASALRVITQAMERSGDIDPRLMATQAVPGGRPGCRDTEPYVLDPSVHDANTISCGCMGTVGRRTPNPRIRINPRAVSHMSSDPAARSQLGAEGLQALLIHEYRHVRQYAEQCNRPGGGHGTGVCTDCNDPTEMDAYLATIEAVTAAEPIRAAWVRVVSNWDFLSDQQQGAFTARRHLAEQKVARYYPRVVWSADAEVLLYQRFCRGLAGGSRGECDSTLAPAR
jgi:hypothetical protein